MLSELCSTIWFYYRSLGSCRKQVGDAEHLIDGSERRICRLSLRMLLKGAVAASWRDFVVIVFFCVCVCVSLQKKLRLADFG